MGLEEWVEIRVLHVVSRHVTAAGAVLGAYAVLHWIIDKSLKDGILKEILIRMDEFLLLNVLALFAVRMFAELMGDDGGFHVLAA